MQLTTLISHILFIGQGVLITIQLLVGSVFIGIIIGTLLSICRYMGRAVYIINSFISIIRGTPLILQLSFVYFALPEFIGIRLSVVIAGVLTFGLNSAAYIAEILRSGIENLPKGQFEAAKTLQVPAFHMWKDIILPQVLHNILPAMINEIITLLKETALIATISGMDIMRRAQVTAAEQFTYFIPLCIAGCYYYILVLIIEQIGKGLKTYITRK